MLKGVRQVKGALDLQEELKGVVGKPKAGRDICLVPGLVRGQGPPGTRVRQHMCRGTDGSPGRRSHTPGGKAAP